MANLFFCLAYTCSVPGEDEPVSEELEGESADDDTLSRDAPPKPVQYGGRLPELTMCSYTPCYRNCRCARTRQTEWAAVDALVHAMLEELSMRSYTPDCVSSCRCARTRHATGTVDVLVHARVSSFRCARTRNASI